MRPVLLLSLFVTLAGCTGSQPTQVPPDPAVVAREAARALRLSCELARLDPKAPAEVLRACAALRLADAPAVVPWSEPGDAGAGGAP